MIRMLGQRLADAQTANAMAGDDAQGMMGGAGDNRYEEVIRATAGFLANEAGPRVAVFDTTGWDTHANEGGARGQLGTRFGALDARAAQPEDPARAHLAQHGGAGGDRVRPHGRGQWHGRQ